MKRKYSCLIATTALVGLGAASCSSSTSPATKALDGDWTTGHACLTLGLKLSWTDAHMSGSGLYRTDDGPTSGCPVLSPLGAVGNVALDARRTSSTALSGTMTFDDKTRATFTGTLTPNPGGGRIDASVLTPDGSATLVTIFEGLIP